jgi:S1-C subfamily serine protease
MQNSCLPIALVSTALLISACAATVAQSPDPEPVGTAPTPMLPSAPDEPAPAAVPAQTKAEPAPPRACDMFAGPGQLRRSALVRLIDAGLPRWMQGVEGDRMLAKHRFAGWLIKSLYPNDPCYQDIDLRRGDVVQKVNGKSIEKPEQAFDVAESLRTAPEIVVEFLRDGKPQRITIVIVDKP